MPTFYPEGSKANGYILKGGEWVEDVPIAQPGRPEVLPEGLDVVKGMFTPEAMSANVDKAFAPLTAPLTTPQAREAALNTGMGVMGGGLGMIKSALGMNHPLRAAATSAEMLAPVKSGAMSIVDKAKGLMPKASPERLAQASEAEAIGLRVPSSYSMNSPTMERAGQALAQDPVTATLFRRGSIPAHNEKMIEQSLLDAMGSSAKQLTPKVLDDAKLGIEVNYTSAIDEVNPMGIAKADFKQIVDDTLGNQQFIGKNKLAKKTKELLDQMPDNLTGAHLKEIDSNLTSFADSIKSAKQSSETGKAAQSIFDTALNSGSTSEKFKLADSQYRALKVAQKSVKQRGGVSPAAIAKSISSRDVNSPLGLLGKRAALTREMSPTTYGTENAARGGLGVVLPTTLLGLAGGGAYGILKD